MIRAYYAALGPINSRLGNKQSSLSLLVILFKGKLQQIMTEMDGGSSYSGGGVVDGEGCVGVGEEDVGVGSNSAEAADGTGDVDCSSLATLSFIV
jgi:hypothetical protein